MSDKFIVRADFYPDGSIIPLGITDEFGNSAYIKRIERIQRISKERGYEIIFHCVSPIGNFLLKYNGIKWGCEKKNS